EVSEYTGFPELLGGRVKTLHPRIHAGILAPGTPEGLAELEAHGLDQIDLVVVNLYPFEETLTIEGVSEPELIEQIDIGGPTLLRAAAKNFARVAVVVDPGDYTLILEQLEDEGDLSLEIRRELAVKVFDRVAAYDIAIANWLRATTPGPASEELPDRIFTSLRRVQPLRYGENPHQQAALYRERGSHPVFYDGMDVLQGKELSYNNLLDLSAALDLIGEFPGEPAAVVIKHGNPAGCAVAPDLASAFEAAWNGDPVAAFGGVVALGAPVDDALGEVLAANFVEVVAAPGFSEGALASLAKKKNLRVIALSPHWLTAQEPRYQVRSTPYGILVQDWDRAGNIPIDEWQVATSHQPSGEQWEALEFAWRCCRHVMSNAIVLAQGRTLVGAGAGQQSRVKSWRLAIEQAGDRARGAVAASDAFLPFEDNVALAREAGIVAIIHPGGSVRDPQVTAAAEAAGISLVVTGVRHFRH
ncbi:MAG TPA: bifunctional phosphoribosylaminoimidazolecarboxamide formyltransferase/IMP cyclohydrolase, partial [bacterium]|nr:bifunctional phosphoribosylaminoimidazolecarboxamide formyltransferase/IMP cyclohydrolase [bacterium]